MRPCRKRQWPAIAGGGWRNRHPPSPRARAPVAALLYIRKEPCPRAEITPLAAAGFCRAGGGQFQSESASGGGSRFAAIRAKAPASHAYLVPPAVAAVPAADGRQT